MGTRSGAPEALRFDLLAELSIALAEREVEEIQFGSSAARSHLVSGWGKDERDDVRGYVWGLGKSSLLHFFAVDAVDLELVFEVRTFSFPGASPQGMRVELNGEVLGEVEVGVEFGKASVAAPARLVQRGRNHLRFLYRYHHRPFDVVEGAQDERELAVLWYDLKLRGLEKAPAPEIVEGGALRLGRGSRVSLFREFTEGDELALGALTTLGAGARLLVEFETLDGGVEGSHVFEAGGSPLLPLPLPVTDQPLRLSLSAIRPAAENAAPAWRETLGRWLGREPVGVIVPLAVVLGTDETMGAGKRAAPADLLADTDDSFVEEDEPRPRTRRPNILIYLIDTLRADHLSLYGYSRPTSPRIDAFGHDAVVFTQARAQTSWTRTAVVSLFTGLLPQVHGVNRRDDALASSLETMAERLGGEGYSTLGFITNGNVSNSFGLQQGFDHYHYLNESNHRWSVHQLSDRLNGRVFKWLEDRRANKTGAETEAETGTALGKDPFFLYLHSTDPHSPYTPPEPFYSQFASHVDRAVGQIDNVQAISTSSEKAPSGTANDFIDLYDAEIAFNDHHFGLLLDRLKADGFYDSMLIVVLSDHGEEFFEHGAWQHGKTLYDEQLHIPLIVKFPNGEGAGLRIDAPARQIDVLPTLLDYLGMEIPSSLDGRSLLPLLEPEETSGETPVETPVSLAYLLLGEQHLESSTGRGYKLIRDLARDRGGQQEELYRLTEDPGEKNDLSGTDLVASGFLRQTLEELRRDLRLRSRGVAPEKAVMSEELRRQLEALGYVK
jgi:arylsulfatase A-like enzyme